MGLLVALIGFAWYCAAKLAHIAERASDIQDRLRRVLPISEQERQDLANEDEYPDA